MKQGVIFPGPIMRRPTTTLGQYSLSPGNPEQAIRACNKALAIKPDYLGAKYKAD